MGQTYYAKLTLTDGAGNVKTMTGVLEDADAMPPEPEPPEPEYAIDLRAYFDEIAAGTILTTVDQWKQIFPKAEEQGVEIKLVKHSEIQHHKIVKGGKNGGNCLERSSPQGSYGMQVSTQLWLGKPTGKVNVECDFMVNTTDGSNTNLFTAGGGKWGFAAIQWGPIQSGPTGGLRLYPIWAAGASTLGRQSLIIGCQNQPDGRQWMQMQSDQPIQQGRWYKARIRMTGATEADPTSVRCEYWLDGIQKANQLCHTDNRNAIAGKADVFVDICGFWGGGQENAAPADAAQYTGEHFRVWVED